MKDETKLLPCKWQLPLRYSGSTVDARIYDADNQFIAELRGWGFLTSPSCAGLSNDEAAQVQDARGHILVEALNERAQLEAEVARLRRWVNDLQSGMFINCVYCGHRYGPSETTPVSMADVLKEHIEQCPKHPMSRFRTALEHYADRANWAKDSRGSRIVYDPVMNVPYIKADFAGNVAYEALHPASGGGE